MKGDGTMEKRDPNSIYSFEYDEQGLNEVSEQIMNSYNSGFMGEGNALADSKDFAATEE